MDKNDSELNQNDDDPTKPAPESVGTNQTKQAKNAVTSYASQIDLVEMFVCSIITIKKETIITDECDVEVVIITDVDQLQLRNKTQTDMADYDPTLSDINEVSNKLFRVGSL